MVDQSWHSIKDMALWPLGSYLEDDPQDRVYRSLGHREREVGPATQIRNLDWLHRLCNNDFVAVSNKTDRGKELVNQIPSQGWVHCRLAHEIGDGTRTPGIGRWDVRGAIFRCMVVCDHCGLVQCNKRMWYALDTHGDRGHTCNNCRPSGRGKGR